MIVLNALLATGLVFQTLLETAIIEIDKKDFISPLVPSNFDGTRLVFISDTHMSPFLTNKKFFERLAKKISFLQPDLLLLGGDYIQSEVLPRKKADYLTEQMRLLSNIRAPLGKYAVLGNHDHKSLGASQTRTILKMHQIKCLDNHAVWIWKGLQRIRLGGVGDTWNEKPDLTPMKQKPDHRTLAILLSHQPQLVDSLPAHIKIDLMLTGHTHGGQIFPLPKHLPFNIGDLIAKRRVRGWQQVNQTTLLISQGIGTEMPYLRFFNQPQIHLITLRRS
ncbi:metallophosphoesterase [Microgenomates group bacterium]|nr:metallophosphoesterase [Microgenomates group bacterium]